MSTNMKKGDIQRNIKEQKQKQKRKSIEHIFKKEVKMHGKEHEQQDNNIKKRHNKEEDEKRERDR